MEKKTAVYICTGCDIGESLNIEELEKVAKGEKAAICKNHAALCSPEGLEMIKKDITGEGVNAIAVAACSPRAMYDTFRFDGCLVERINLREQVVWSHEPNDEDTQLMAEDYLLMGMAKLKGSKIPVAHQPDEPMSKDILVVGGGITGLTAALESAKAGYNTVLVEKEETLGGNQAKVSKVAAFPYKELQDNTIDTVIKGVTDNDKITVYTGATVAETDGSPGLFKVKIDQKGSTKDHTIGAIVMAAGFTLYDPSKLDDSLGFGKNKDVITNAMFEEQVKDGTITKPSDGGSVKNAVFIQCAGQRDPKHLPYCSSFCCITALKQAIQIKEQDSDANVYVVFQEMRTPGHAEDLYLKAQEAGVIFIRSQDAKVKTDGGLAVEAVDELMEETVELDNLDLVVLATGLVPATAEGEDVYAKQMEEEEKDKKDKKDELVIPADVIRQSNILNLKYRQGPELPALANDFPDSHYICFPYESRRTGIYPAGCVRRPMGLTKCIEDAQGAVMKAIQCVELVTKGMAVHPRSEDIAWPEFNMQRCTQCKRCTVECPFGAINEDEKGNPIHQVSRCRRCGICMGACPERIISFPDYSVAIIGNSIKAMEVPDEDEEKPRILVLACENDAYPALDAAGLHRMKYNAWVRVVPLRCLGSMNLVWIADSLSKGIDGVFLLGCKHGDDYQCHYIRGSELSNIRLSKVSETLDRMALESERVRYESVSIADYRKLPAMLDEFAETIDEVGPNPFKGF